MDVVNIGEPLEQYKKKKIKKRMDKYLVTVVVHLEQNIVLQREILAEIYKEPITNITLSATAGSVVSVSPLIGQTYHKKIPMSLSKYKLKTK